MDIMSKEKNCPDKDALHKVLAQAYKGKSFAVLGIKLPPIRELLPAIPLRDSFIDSLFLLEDGTYTVVEYASGCHKTVAIAKTVMGTNEKLLVLYPTREGMIVKTLFYHDEIATVPKQMPKITLDKNELDMAKMLVENMTKPFVPEDFQDEYQARLREAIMKKIQGQEIVTADTSEPGNVIDLMEALQKSLEMSKGNGRKKTGTA